MQRLEEIEQKVLALSRFVKEITVTMKNGAPFAYICPDLEAFKEAKIVNIEEEIRWYAVELYNIYAKDGEKIKGYEISIPQVSADGEPDDEIYKALKRFLSDISSKEVSFTAHIELDLGLDSLDYVQLFVFVEQSFGVKMDESLFSGMMRVQELYMYIKQEGSFGSFTALSWEEILKQKSPERLMASPFFMFMYKLLLYPLFKLYFRLEVKGVENIPNSACVISPSHQSMLDGFLIEALLPFRVLKNTYFMSYKQVFGRNILKYLAKHGQNILIDANENLKETLIASAGSLGEGKNVVIFPEGARSRDGELLEFRPFFAIAAKTYGVPVVPVMIDGGFDALRTGMLFPRPKKIKVTFLRPIEVQEMSYEEIVKKTRDAIEHELKKARGLL